VLVINTLWIDLR